MTRSAVLSCGVLALALVGEDSSWARDLPRSDPDRAAILNAARGSDSVKFIVKDLFKAGDFAFLCALEQEPNGGVIGTDDMLDVHQWVLIKRDKAWTAIRAGEGFAPDVSHVSCGVSDEAVGRKDGMVRSQEEVVRVLVGALREEIQRNLDQGSFDEDNLAWLGMLRQRGLVSGISIEHKKDKLDPVQLRLRVDLCKSSACVDDNKGAFEVLNQWRDDAKISSLVWENCARAGTLVAVQECVREMSPRSYCRPNMTLARDRKDVEQCLAEIGSLCRRTIGTSKNADPLERSCSDGDSSGCISLGYLYDYGEGGVSEDRARAAELYQRGCDAKNGVGCGDLASLYSSGRGAKAGIAKDRAKAVEYYSRGCALKHAKSCYNLGVAYQMGETVAKNDARAAELYEIACRADDAEACNNLGFMYFSGLGVERDLGKARDLYRRACASGVGRGCSNWAFLFETAPADLIRAAILYCLACALGDAKGCTNFESLPGRNSRSFRKRAWVVWAELDRDCDKGSAESCRLGGVQLQSGIGIAPKPSAARNRFDEGCRLLDHVSCDALKMIDEAHNGHP